ncbi:MAG: FecR domain-containing protein [Proteobacteria bacterium]|nr:FecR domain-containing protein [Pseudomonadota bacterium]
MKNDQKGIIRRYFISFLIGMAIICWSAYAEETDPAGHAIFVHGPVWRIPVDMTKMPLQKGDSVYEADTIMTGKTGAAQLIMSDGAYIAIRPNSSIRLDVYHYDKEEETGVGESIITLIKGCFRSITGLIGKENKENYRIKTPVATIGIRGTDHEPLYIPEPEEGEIPIGEPGLYDKVNSGETYIENDAGIVTILPNQVGYVSDQTTLAIVDDTIPDVYDQFSATGSEESMETSDEQTTEPTMSIEGLDVFSSTTSLAEQMAAQSFAPDMPVIEDKPVQYFGLFTWPDAVNYQGIIGFGADATEVDTDDTGNLTGYHLPSRDFPDPEWIQTLRMVNPTAATRQESNHYSETSIEYGTWQADAIERINYDGVIENFPIGNGLAHWIKGSISDSNYLSQVITGTQIYTFDGGTAPTNQDGIGGTLNSAALSVDFSRQALDVALQLNVNSHDWSAGATNVPIDRGLFTASSPVLTVDRDGDSAYTWGYLNGSFAGQGLRGALLGYTLGDTSISETVNGTAAFYAPEQDSNAPYREIGIAGTDPRTPLSSALALHSPSATSTISMDGSENLTGFDAMLPTYSIMPSGDAQSPVHLDIGAATLTDTQTDTDSGITWGRWSGTITATDRVTQTTASPSFDPQELHFIAGPEMSSPVVLPITGTKTYQFAGGTQPTDNMGNIGTLNSASLSADFTNMTVATGINATVGTTTFDARSEATPIESGRYFNATHNDSLSIACTGADAGTTHTGVISGAFYGEHGESAGLAYSFNTTDGGSIDTTIAGTAAFK